MKQFKKINDTFVCEECGHICKNKGELSKHINRVHSNTKEYFDKWIKEEGDDKCKICGCPTNFTGLKKYYENGCSKQCKIKYTTLKQQETFIEKFGSTSPFGNKSIQEKSKTTMVAKYGVEHYTNPNKNKETCLKRYGVDNGSKTKEAKLKISQTCLKNNGVSWPMQSDIIKKKSKHTCLKKYGVEHPSQNESVKAKMRRSMKEKYGVEFSAQSPEILDKQIKTKISKYGEDYNKLFHEKSKKTMKLRYGDENYNNRKKARITSIQRYGDKNFNNREKARNTVMSRYGTNHPMQDSEINLKQQRSCFRVQTYKNSVLYQGSYELDFLEKYYEIFPDIIRGPRIKYTYQGKTHYYFADYLIPSRNLIIEIKNSYLAKKDKNILDAKKRACVNQGYQWFMITDKDYSYFNDFNATQSTDLY